MTEPYTIESVAKMLCTGEICGENKCRVLAEDCCPCVFAGNALMRGTAALQGVLDDCTCDAILHARAALKVIEDE